MHKIDKMSNPNVRTVNINGIRMYDEPLDFIEVSRTTNPAHVDTNQGVIFKSADGMVKTRTGDEVFSEPASNFVIVKRGGQDYMFRKSQISGDGRMVTAEELVRMHSDTVVIKDGEQTVTKNDIVQAVSSTDLDHFHAIWVRIENGALIALTSFETIEQDDEGRPIMHDHRILQQGDMFILLENGNPRHSHRVTRDELTQDLIRTINKSVDLDSLIAHSPSIQKGITTMSDDNKTTEPTNEELLKRIERLTQENDLTDGQKVLYKSMSDSDKEAFLAKSAEEREAEVAKSSQDDETMEFEGLTISKSSNPTAFVLAKKMQTQAEEFALEKSAREDLEIEKRAELILKNVPGDIRAKSLIVKAVENCQDEEVKKVAEEFVQSINLIAKSMTSPSGASSEGISTLVDAASGGTSSEEALSKLRGLANELVTKSKGTDNPLSYSEAYERVRTDPANHDTVVKARTKMKRVA